MTDIHDIRPLRAPGPDISPLLYGLAALLALALTRRGGLSLEAAAAAPEGQGRTRAAAGCGGPERLSMSWPMSTELTAGCSTSGYLPFSEGIFMNDTGSRRPR